MPMFIHERCPTISALFITLLMSGCGTSTPSFHEFYDSEDSTTLVEGVTEHAQCEVQDAVQFMVLDYRDAVDEQIKLDPTIKRPATPPFSWLSKWDAQITFVMTVDEKSSLNPSLALTPPLTSAVTRFSNNTTTTTPQSFSGGIGATASVDATRKGTISWLIKFADLTTDDALAKARTKRDAFYKKIANERDATTIPSSCDSRTGPFIEGDLKFREWLYSALLGAAVTNGILGDYSKELEAEASASKKDVIQDDITFVVLYGGSVDPVWKLLRVSADQASPPLFGVQRTRTQDLLITLGPATTDGTLSPRAQDQALASLIGIAVANAIRNTQ